MTDLSDGLPMRVVKKARGVSLLIVKLVAPLGRLEVGLEAGRLGVVRRRRGRRRRRSGSAAAAGR